jgi:deoxyribose-phosphate aldolase
MEFPKYFDHTILSPFATKGNVEQVCREALEKDFAAVCVNGCYTKLVSEILQGSNVRTCTVIGFPLGAHSESVKIFEAQQALKDGADEIDMVINIGALKDGDWAKVEKEIRKIKKVCGEKVLKVIVETCLLTQEEKKSCCEVVSRAGADYIKTSPGFSTGGALAEDVKLFRVNLSDEGKIKASGGIRDYETAQLMIEAGADRLGTSATLIILEKYQNQTF